MNDEHSSAPLLALLDRLERTFERIVFWCCGPVGLVVVAVITVVSIAVLRQPQTPAFGGVLRPAREVAIALEQKIDRSRTTATPAIASCPTTAVVQQLTGASVVRFGEPCGFHWDGAQLRVICPRGFRCTFDLGRRIVVLTGANQSFDVVSAATWRYVAAYPVGDIVRDGCALLTFEQRYAARYGPRVPVESWGFACAATSPTSQSKQTAVASTLVGMRLNPLPPPHAAGPTKCQPTDNASISRKITSSWFRQYQRLTGISGGFEQDGQLVWENRREAGMITPANHDTILSQATFHQRFHSGALEVWVRASSCGAFSRAEVVTFCLQWSLERTRCQIVDGVTSWSDGRCPNHEVATAARTKWKATMASQRWFIAARRPPANPAATGERRAV